MITKVRIFNFFIFIFSILALSSCGPASIEEQVEELIKSEDYNERKEIACSLADSLSTYPLELLVGINASNSSQTSYYAEQAIKDILSRYPEILKEHPITSYINLVMTCVQFVTEPSIQRDKSLDQKKIDYIIHGLLIRDSHLYYQKSLARSAKKHGKSAMVRIIEEWKQNKDSKELLYAISFFEDDAIAYLSDRIVEDKDELESIEELLELEPKDAIELLARIGEPAVSLMKKKMRDDEQSVRFAAGDVLVSMLKYHPDVVPDLTSAINKNGVNTIAKNYPFYIRLGQINTEKILLKALDRNFTTDMCVDYLNCGNKELEDGATSIAWKKGYMVTPGFGGHSGPQWGSGN